MALTDIKIENLYWSQESDFVRDFFVPVLAESCKYDRAVGFFSSSSLARIMDGLYPFFKNGGQIRLIASPQMSEEDYKSIEKGYVEREVAIKRNLIQSLMPVENNPDRENLNLLSYLIAKSQLDIKIAVTSSVRGIYHEKIGLMRDSEGNSLGFLGSLNETGAALNDNYENIATFKGWGDGKNQVEKLSEHFEKLWMNRQTGLRTYEFPEIKEEIVRKFRLPHEPIKMTFDIEKIESISTKKNLPCIPKDITFHGYQLEAIEKFINQKGRGIFDMATGTGKTFTALGAIARLAYEKKYKLGIIICVPYQHLVKQWQDEVVKFGINPIIAYSESDQKNWRDTLKREILKLRLGIGENQFFCVIATNCTFGQKSFQSILWGNIATDEQLELLLVVDEAHNFGAPVLKTCLDDRIKYRLALSATLSRHHDPEGTAALESFFGKKCIVYSLAKAIQEGVLTPYSYHPIFVSLNSEERDAYLKLSREIGKETAIQSGKLSKKAELLLIERSRIIANAVRKIPRLLEEMSDFKNESHMLVYCGSTSIVQDRMLVDEEDKVVRQVEEVTDCLNDIGIKAAKFTSESKQRDLLITGFSYGSSIQALVAIKCLDEGVNICSIKAAFILASSTNPKEYVQRRGRVLRKFSGKTQADIYDFITLPYDFDDIASKGIETRRSFRQLLSNECARFSEFNSLANNKDSNYVKYLQLCNLFGITPQNSKNEGDDDE